MHPKREGATDQRARGVVIMVLAVSLVSELYEFLVSEKRLNLSEL